MGKIEGFVQNAAGGLIQKENGGSFSFKMPVGEFVMWAVEERGSRMKPEVQDPRILKENWRADIHVQEMSFFFGEYLEGCVPLMSNFSLQILVNSIIRCCR